MPATELDVALAAAHGAGELLRPHFSRGVAAERKGLRDLVTIADRESEALVRAHIADAFGDLVVGEEGRELPEAEVRGRRRWYVDPLDGTTNFVKGQPRWGVSVGFCGADDVMAAGVVHVPLTGETFAAVRGEGATCNGTPIRASDVTTQDALALLGPLDGMAGAVAPLSRAVLSMRITGSTVCDLADVGCGRGDLYLGVRQGRWDLAAGVLVAAEGGATVSDLYGRPQVGPADAVFAAAPRVHAALLPALRAALKA